MASGGVQAPGAAGFGSGVVAAATPDIGRNGLGPWPRFLLRKVADLAFVLVLLVTITFFMVRLVPGDPVHNMVGIGAQPEQVRQVRHDLGLDRPLPSQFRTYLAGVARFDFGTSFQNRQAVDEIIRERLSRTMQLAGTGFVLVLLLSTSIGMTAGVLTGDGRRRRLASGFTFATSLGATLPEYLAATALVLVLGIWLDVLPVAGIDGWQSLVMPALAVSIGPVAVLSRIVRRETLTVLSQDYMRTARAKRLPRRTLYFRHALPNLLTASLTLGGLLLAGLLGGAVVVENVFGWPGLGTKVVEAVAFRDYPVIQGIVLLLGVAVVLVNTVIDVVLGMIDPRSLVRTGRP